MKKAMTSMLAAMVLAGVFALYGCGGGDNRGTVKIIGSNVTIEEAVTDKIIKQIKKEAGDKDLNFSLQKMDDIKEIEKFCDAYPGVKQLTVKAGKNLTSIAPLAKLKSLTRLYVDGDSIADFSPLKDLTALSSLSIDSKAMGSDLKWMSGLTNLQTINIQAGDKLVSFEGIPSLPALNSITLKNAAPADLSPLKALPGLKTIDFMNAKIADLTPLAELHRLEKLNLYGATVKDFSPLAKCAALKELNFYATKNADYSTLGKLTQLHVLEGGLTSLDDISWISKLTNLKKYTMFAEKVKDYTPLSKLKLEEFMIWSMNVEGPNLSFISGMTSLRKLTLDTLNGVTNLKALQSLTSLKTLKITKINDKGGESIPLDVIKKLPNLEDLTITKGTFTDDQLKGFANSGIKISQW